MVRPKCPKCEAELDLKNDIKWENVGSIKSITVYYCGKCGAIFNVGAQRMLSNKSQ
ncbi:hypothetical protein ACNF40_08685 [Cuniculiplasma sp. SKW4]